jgi:hypothetical protein
VLQAVALGTELRNACGRGDLRQRVCIGDIRVDLTSDDPTMEVDVCRTTRRFLVDGGRPDASLSTVWGDLRRPVAGVEIFDSGGLWKLYRDASDYVFSFNSPIFGEHAYKEARFNSDFTSGALILHAGYGKPDEPVFPLEYPLDELLLTNLLARGRGVEVHACAVRDQDGCGYLFLGHSGAGKTTMAKLWEQAGGLILSDDRIILRHLEGKIWMYGTPWHGEAQLAAAIRTELTRMFVLGRGATNEWLPMALPEVVANLFTRSFVPFYDAAALAYTLEVLQHVAAAAPCAHLRFMPDASVVDFVRQHPI